MGAFPDKAENKWSSVQHKETLLIITFVKEREFIFMTEKDTDEMTVCSADQHCHCFPFLIHLTLSFFNLLCYFWTVNPLEQRLL